VVVGTGTQRPRSAASRRLVALLGAHRPCHDRRCRSPGGALPSSGPRRGGHRPDWRRLETNRPPLTSLGA